MPLASVTDTPSLSSSPELATTIFDRLSQELVIALVGPVGSGVSTAAKCIEKILANEFSYTVSEIIKPSDIIRAEAYRVRVPVVNIRGGSRNIGLLQDAGNKLRQRFGGAYLIEKAIEKIHTIRSENGGHSDGGAIIPHRRAYIIDSIKNHDELSLLRQIYQSTLCVFGVFAPDAMRSRRLLDSGMDDQSIEEIMNRDKGEIATFGQKTKKVFVESDFFLCNDLKRENLEQKIRRYLGLIFNSEVHTPTRAETAMYRASSAAANSACMSRQVGAAIMSDLGELIAVGWNDVPKFGGGLYAEDDQFSAISSSSKSIDITDKDCRCFKWKGGVCHNEFRRGAIIKKVTSKIVSSGILKRGKTESDVVAAVQGTPVDALIEYSRSIHAEMEAILSVAREGKHSLVGATLYTNTYPCHNCARHIVASGIQSVVYIEPYDKSLAIALHDDSISEDPLAANRVIFRQYDGVAPRNFLLLFRPTQERKINGKLRTVDAKTALPVFRIPLDSLILYEQNTIAALSSSEASRG